jgi:hypothetical protein
MAGNKSKTEARDPSRTGFIVFASWDPHYEVECLLGDGAGNLTAGFGGWDKIKRDRRTSLTEWSGRDGMEIPIPVIFENWRSGESIEPDIKQIEKMAGLGNQGGGEPPLMTFNTGGVVAHDYHDAPKHDWVITDVEFGDCVKNNYGNRVRQIATITVSQYIDDDVLEKLSPAGKHRDKNKGKIKKGTERSGGKKKEYVVKFTHQSLVAIAKEVLGDGKRWHEIAKLNNIRDPKATKKGQLLRIP